MLARSLRARSLAQNGFRAVSSRCHFKMAYTAMKRKSKWPGWARLASNQPLLERRRIAAKHSGTQNKPEANSYARLRGACAALAQSLRGFAVQR